MAEDRERVEGAAPTARPCSAWRRWIHRGFLAWAAFAMLWLANSVRTRSVPPELLESNADVTVERNGRVLALVPGSGIHAPALIFFCGSGIAPEAYAPLLHPLAEAGHAVFVIGLPLRFAPRESDKLAAIADAWRVMQEHSAAPRWIFSGHSLGGGLAARAVHADPRAAAGLVLIGTTHPKRHDLSSLTIPVVKIVGTHDGVAPLERMQETEHLLPPHTRRVEIEGGNHSQFGHYGSQLFDDEATVTREEQQQATRAVLREVLATTGE